ncbi:MAG TPA: hypothetical protein VFP71_08230 [Candidatus Angelobacter sp.]|nr:hypothetical protein [Candidatus Angelobacter sp.]
MPKLSGILSVFALFLFAIVAHSQGKIVISAQAGNGAGSGSGVSQSSGNAQISVGVGGGMIGFVGSAPSGVKGLPFSADVVEETDQYLANGNHIHRENHGKVFRDSEGRMRTENEIGSGIVGSKPFLHILINDPVQNTFILLNPENKAATVHHLMQRPVAASGSNSVPTNASPTQARTTASDPQSQALIQSLRDKRDQSMVRQHSREDLGTMEIEGFTVKGTRLTTTTPAGAMGNDKPMTTTSERWFSEDLKMELLTKSSSPESGQHVRRLVNIRSGDPDPLLFQVPVDYTVKEQQ